jgi:hypothetical protein
LPHYGAHQPGACPRTNATRHWSLCERLTGPDIAELITVYRSGATAASLAAAHGVSLTASSASCAPLMSAGR